MGGAIPPFIPWQWAIVSFRIFRIPFNVIFFSTRHFASSYIPFSTQFLVRGSTSSFMTFLFSWTFFFVSFHQYMGYLLLRPKAAWDFWASF